MRHIILLVKKIVQKIVIIFVRDESFLTMKFSRITVNNILADIESLIFAL